jgi:hypothetical protein
MGVAFGWSDGLWRCDGGFFDAGLLPGGYEAWEIFGICEEGEDDVNRVGEPLFGVKCVSHAGGSFLSLSCSSQLRRSGDVARLVVGAKLIA